VLPEGLGKFKNSPHRVSNSRPSGLYHSALFITYWYIQLQVSKANPTNSPTYLSDLCSFLLGSHVIPVSRKVFSFWMLCSHTLTVPVLSDKLSDIQFCNSLSCHLLKFHMAQGWIASLYTPPLQSIPPLIINLRAALVQTLPYAQCNSNKSCQDLSITCNDIERSELVILNIRYIVAGVLCIVQGETVECFKIVQG
jgi:hypothetical protein